MERNSPTLYFNSFTEEWKDPESYTWVCNTINNYWNITGYDKIWIYGSDEYMHGCFEARPLYQQTSASNVTYFRMWNRTERGEYRCDRYAHWLAAFNVPCVWIWIEGAP